MDLVSMSDEGLSLTILVPAYNSALILPDLVARVEAMWALLGVGRETHELILVNDASSDNTWKVISDLATLYPWVRGIDLMRNSGQHNALLCGIRAARFDFIVTIDDDLQNPPEEIPKLLNELAQGFDVVYGTPAQEQHGLWRDMASKVTKVALQSAMGARTARKVSAFRAFRTILRDAFAAYQGPYVSIDVLLTWGSTRFSSVTVEHDPRRIGTSNYTLRKLLSHALNMITGFSVLPLQLASMVGFFFTLVGIALLVYVLAIYFIAGGSVAGFPFLASALAIFSGAQLFALGIIGEYLARMHFRMMDRPAYTVRESTQQH